MQLYWNHTSAWVISSKFAAFLQNTFSEEHLWRAASGHLHYNKKHTATCFLSLSTVIIHHSHPDSLHSPHFHHSPHSVPWFPIPAFTDSHQFFLILLNVIVMQIEKTIINDRLLFSKVSIYLFTILH